ncbi:MAG: 30S ribosomal protein THX [Rhodospirillaceae bacterium]
MGKGDSRTKRGKIFKGSYGKTRPHHPKAKKKQPQKAAGRGR